MKDFSVEELEIALKPLKIAKHLRKQSVYGILQEFLKNLGIKGKLWLRRIFSLVKNNNVLSKLWRV